MIAIFVILLMSLLTLSRVDYERIFSNDKQIFR